MPFEKTLINQVVIELVLRWEPLHFLSVARKVCLHNDQRSEQSIVCLAEL